MDHIVVDVEIAKTIEEVGGWDHTDKMGVSCAVVYEYEGDRYRVYGPTPEDLLRLQQRLMQADRITTFNGWRFDFPVIWGLPSRSRVLALREKSNDLLCRIWKSLGLDEEKFSDLHKGWGLDAICKGTFGEGKSGYGGDAPKWFQQGDWARLVDYCIDDVRLEKKLGQFIDTYEFVVHPEKGVLRITA